MSISSSKAGRHITIPQGERNAKPLHLGLRHRKMIAKLGMAGSLGTLFISGLLKFRGAKSLHIYSGVGLLGFTVWHHFLNKPRGSKKR